MKRFAAILSLTLLFAGQALAGGKQNPLKPDRDDAPVFAPVVAGHTGHLSRPPGETTMLYLLDEGFEGTFPPAGWTVLNPDGALTWARSSAASAYGHGTASLRMNFYSYDPNLGQVDSLLSPVVTGLVATDSLLFDYAYCGFPGTVVGPDTVEVYLSTDGGATFPHLIVVLSTPDSTAPTNVNGWAPSASQWGSRRYTLPAGAIGGSVRLLFVSHNHYAQNFYLDNIRLGTRPVHDVSPLSFTTPADGGSLVETLPFTPAAEFQNTGSADQLLPFTVRFEILDTSAAVVYGSSRLLAPLNSGSTQTVTFDPVSAGLPAGVYGLRAITALAGDEITANDTITGRITVEVRVTAFPYVQDFEGVTDAGWRAKAVTGSKNDWERGTPAKPLQLRSAHGGVNAWVTRLDTTYSNSHNAALFSPYFDLAGATSRTTLEFYQNFRIESGWDAGVLEYSTNFGSTWLKMDTTLGRSPDYYTVKSRRWYNNSDTDGNVVPPKWSDTSTAYATNDSGWIRSTTSLGRLAGQSNVRFRWRFRTDGSEVEEGWAVDDVRIFEDSLRTVRLTSEPGWRLVSLPVETPDSVYRVFPCLGSMFVVTFGASGYEQAYTLQPGTGAWGKFTDTCDTFIEGGARDTVSVPVMPGWNLVGCPSFPLDAAAVTSTPPGLVVSSWFSYATGYQTVTKLEPGKAYWVKSSGPGVLRLQGVVPALKP